MWLAIKYAVFAGISVMVNMLAQDVTIRPSE